MTGKHESSNGVTYYWNFDQEKQHLQIEYSVEGLYSLMPLVIWAGKCESVEQFTLLHKILVLHELPVNSVNAMSLPSGEDKEGDKCNP